MNEERLTEIVTKAMNNVKIVPGPLFGHHSKKYMKDYITEVIKNYDKEKIRYNDDEKFEYHCPT